jgi:hypothetical protein
MRSLDLGSLAAVAAGTAFQGNGNGFLPGELVKAEIFSPDGAFAGSARLQTSPDGTTWTDVGPAAHTTAGYNTYMITLSSYVRLNATARTAGTIRAVLFNDIG